MPRRAYGIGTLRVVGRSWIGSWYGPDGRRVQRKIGAVRTDGRADGLTKAQAERVLRRMREIDAPRSAPGVERVTMEPAGAEFCQRLELKGRRKSHRLTVASDVDLGLRKGWCQTNPVKLADRPTVKKTETRIQFLDLPGARAAARGSVPG
jgi:integrase